MEGDHDQSTRSRINGGGRRMENGKKGSDNSKESVLNGHQSGKNAGAAEAQYQDCNEIKRWTKRGLARPSRSATTVCAAARSTCEAKTDYNLCVNAQQNIIVIRTTVDEGANR
ncbi:hypothetical protein HPB48_003350 [Haemaphysalis longicornis]|uniref:Uncharacterized protein n=1 Tax=Haemaphysalis longicornis TaxID=44386 RepID=A0A9J6G7L7_HAELO|nr:hypothetical protein HPB48_003350 [Haemaphysalis longicornis]